MSASVDSSQHVLRPIQHADIPFTPEELDRLEAEYNVMQFRILPQGSFSERFVDLFRQKIASGGALDRNALGLEIQTHARNELLSAAAKMQRQRTGFVCKSSNFADLKQQDAVLSYYTMDNFWDLLRIGDILPELLLQLDGDRQSLANHPLTPQSLSPELKTEPGTDQAALLSTKIMAQRHGRCGGGRITKPIKTQGKGVASRIQLRRSARLAKGR